MAQRMIASQHGILLGMIQRGWRRLSFCALASHVAAPPVNAAIPQLLHQQQSPHSAHFKTHCFTALFLFDLAPPYLPPGPGEKMAQDELDDLIGFLNDKRADVKHTAMDIILGLTASPEGVQQLKAKTNKLLVFSLRLICDPDKELSRKALSSLVNLSQDKDMVEALLKQNIIARSMDYLKEQSCPHPRLLVMLLSNLTSSSEEGCSQMLQLGQDKLEGLHVAILLKRFVMSGLTFEEGSEDAYEHVASILTNVTRFKRAREMLLQPGRGTLQALAAQLRAPGLLRRQGVAGAIRNCCMSAEDDGTLQQVVEDPAVLSCMLGPISGTEPKESDDLVRECMAESIMVLASHEVGRKALWEVQAPEKLKAGYEYEVHPAVCKALEHAAEYFISHSQIEDKLGVLSGGAPPAAAPPQQQEQGQEGQPA